MTMPDSVAPSPVAIVGAGAVGATLARGLQSCGYPVAAVLSRSTDTARTLADRVGASVADTVGTSLPPTVRLVFLCVPDDAIASVAEALAEVDHPWPDTIAAHTSGAQTAAALAPLARQDAATMSFHPMQTFAPDTSPEAFEDIVVGLEGDERALAAGETLARALGAWPVRLTPKEKVRYHCAAALASNGLVALMGVVEEVFGAPQDTLAGTSSPADLVGPLVEQTWANLEGGSPEEVLTGPVQRGDEETLRAHLEALRAETPHLVPLYAALSTEMVRTAVRGGDLSPSAAEDLLAMLRAAAEAVGDDPSPPSPSR
jgi:predicted short-subunit dehydrogenase-like oxidoreductase (DUF2520 family)